MALETALEGNIGVITASHSPIDITSPAVRAGLAEAWAAAEGEEAIAAIVLHLVGDVEPPQPMPPTSFVPDPETPFLADITAKIEAATKPWVAVLHGHITGPTFEFALGCHYRVAAADVQLGLPRGGDPALPPCTGATVRLPRLIGAEAAMDMIQDGDLRSAQWAEEHGLIDLSMDEEVHEAAVAFVNASMVGKTLRPTLSRPVKHIVDVAAWEARKADIASPGLIAALKAVEHGLQHPGNAALVAERLMYLACKNFSAKNS